MNYAMNFDMYHNATVLLLLQQIPFHPLHYFLRGIELLLKWTRSYINIFPVLPICPVHAPTILNIYTHVRGLWEWKGKK